MKKIFTLFIILLILSVFALPCFSSSKAFFITDNASILSSTEEASLDKKLADISDSYGIDAVIYTEVKGGYTSNSYVESLYCCGPYSDNGVILYIDMSSRDIIMRSLGNAKDKFNYSNCSDIIDSITEDLSEAKYYDAFCEFADECGDIIADRFELGKSLVICVVIGLVLALIVTLIMKAQLKSVRFNSAASDYVVHGSLNVTQSRDIYLYSTLTRTPKPKSNSSGKGSAGMPSNGARGKF